MSPRRRTLPTPPIVSFPPGAATSQPAQGGRAQREQLTVDELCSELKVARRTFYDWRAKGRAPRCLKLPNGDLRIRRIDLDAWLTDRMEG